MSITVPMQGFGGGVPLNFKVVGNPQPTNPKENSIWLNTDEKITGWYFQEKQPENMQHGEIFIATGTQSPVNFNALKKNGITVYPLKAQQMVSGTLKDIEAKIFKNDEWVDLTYLFDLDAIEWSVNSSDNYSYSLSNTDGKLNFATTNKKPNVYVRASTKYKKATDLSAYKTAEITSSWDNCRVQSGSGQFPCYGGFLDKSGNEVAIIQLNQTLSTHKLDISHLSGEHYFFVNVSMGGGASVSATVEEVELM